MKNSKKKIPDRLVDSCKCLSVNWFEVAEPAANWFMFWHLQESTRFFSRYFMYLYPYRNSRGWLIYKYPKWTYRVINYIVKAVLILETNVNSFLVHCNSRLGFIFLTKVVTSVVFCKSNEHNSNKLYKHQN